MLFRRLFALIAISVLIGQTASGQVSTPVPRAERPGSPTPKQKPVSTPSGPQITFNSVYVEGPYIAVTFDDGPHATLTPKLLDLLAARNLKATLFVVGQNVAEYPEILKRAVREGHEIASHSWSHPNLGKMSDDAVRRELQKTDDAIVAATGKRPTLMRPPYGSITAAQKRWIYEEFGYRIIIWDVDPLDWKRPGPSVVTARILKETKPGSIILAHDIHPPTLEAMPATFDQLVKKGFKFVTVTELLAMAKPQPKPTPSPSVPRAEPVPTATPVSSPAVTTETPGG
ncbi:MAG TPA: polysaccharide deacetylase family protein [Chthoniobacterales bacterium]|nr:polysaccharide deacetylase family protein [Chthoniobacterales bacterium]